MKNILVLMTILSLSTANHAFARGFIGNPDRYPSIGLSFGYSFIDGNIDFPTNTIPPLQSVEEIMKKRDLTIDLRLPISHSLTIFGGFSFQDNEFSNGGNGFELKKERNLNGFGFRLGARYYFNRK